MTNNYPDNYIDLDDWQEITYEMAASELGENATEEEIKEKALEIMEEGEARAEQAYDAWVEENL
jgi:hypothetical protein